VASAEVTGAEVTGAEVTGAEVTGAEVTGRRLTGPVALAATVLAVSVALHLRDPHRSGSWGHCPWLLVTGTYCPGCGGLRAVADLTRGDVGAAASSNLLLVASAPLLVGWWLTAVVDRWRGVGRSVAEHRQLAAALAFVAVAVGFAVLRNTDAGAWLAP
jgi:Protein of unknown function (DUF2752)